MLMFVLGACTPQTSPEEPTKPVELVDGDDDATVVCNRLRELGCPESRDTPEGNTCEEVLRNAAAEGIDLVGDVDCVVASTSCVAAEACD